MKELFFLLVLTVLCLSQTQVGQYCCTNVTGEQNCNMTEQLYYRNVACVNDNCFFPIAYRNKTVPGYDFEYFSCYSPMYSVQTCNLQCNPPNSNCSGDANYCNQTNCSSDPQSCYCTTKFTSFAVFATDGISSGFSELVDSWCSLLTNSEDFDPIQAKRSVTSGSIQTSPSGVAVAICFLSYQNYIITANCLDSNYKTYTIINGNLRTVGYSTSQIFQIDTTSVCTSNAPISVQLYENLVYTNDVFYCPEQDSVESTSSALSPTDISNWYKLGYFGKLWEIIKNLLVIVTLVTIICLVVKFFILFWRFLKWSFGGIYKTKKVIQNTEAPPIYQDMRNRVKTVFKYVTPKFQSDAPEEMMEQGDSPVLLRRNNVTKIQEEIPTLEGEDERKIVSYALPEKRNKKHQKQVQYKKVDGVYYPILMMMFFKMCFGQNCDVSTVLTGTQYSQCTVGPNSVSCQMFLPTQITLPRIGYNNCFLINTFVNNVTITLASIEISYSSHVTSAPTSTLYYTSDWNGFSQSVHVCNNDLTKDYRACGSSNCNYISKTDGTAGGNLNNPNVVNFPGISYCTTSCQCISCDGCVSCEPSCLYYRWSVVPSVSSGIYQVNHPFLMQNTPSITIKISTSDGQQQTSTVTTSSQVTYLTLLRQNLKVTIDGSYTGTSSIFGANNVVYNAKTGVAYLSQTSESGSPVALTVGDIQGSSPSSFTQASSSSFIFTQNVAVCTPSNYQANCVFSNSGIKQSSLLATLPTSFLGDIWFYNNTLPGLQCNNPQNPGGLVVSLLLPGALSVAAKVYVVCPVIVSISVAGCFSCENGGYLIVTSYSTCFSGFVGVTLTADASSQISLITKTLLVNTTYSKQNISIVGSSQTASGTLCLNPYTTGQVSSCLSFKGVLTNVIILPNSTINSGTQTYSSNQQGLGQNFLDFLNLGGLSSIFKVWWFDLIFALFIIMGLLITIHFIYKRRSSAIEYINSKKSK